MTKGRIRSSLCELYINIPLLGSLVVLVPMQDMKSLEENQTQ